MDFDETWYAWNTQGPLQVWFFYSARWPRIPTGIYVFQCINLFQNGQSLLLLWHNNKLVYPPDLSRIVGFCTNSDKIFLGEDPRPPFQAELFEPVL